MLQHLFDVFSRLQQAGQKRKARKCHQFAKKVEFSGHNFEEEINTDPKKTVCASEIGLFLLLLRKFTHS